MDDLGVIGGIVEIVVMCVYLCLQLLYQFMLVVIVDEDVIWCYVGLVGIELFVGGQLCGGFVQWVIVVYDCR